MAEDYIICARLPADYQEMVVKLKFLNESNSKFIRRAIDALALTDENLQVILGEEDYGV